MADKQTMEGRQDGQEQHNRQHMAGGRGSNLTMEGMRDWQQRVIGGQGGWGRDNKFTTEGMWEVLQQHNDKEG